jgi:Flp pilus assembly protein CpaB
VSDRTQSIDRPEIFTMGKRSNLIVTLGLAVFIVGAAATYLVVRNSDSAPASSAGKSSVLVATKPIPAGTTGTAVFAQGMVKGKAIDPSAKPATAVTDASQLAGKTTTLGVAEGQVLTLDQFQDAQTRIGTLKIPDGKTALALSMSNVPGVAGFAGAGDHINIYGVVKPGDDPKNPQGATHLITQNTEVLNVNGTTLAATQGQPGGTGLVYLLAVNPSEAERLIYLNSFEGLYFSLVSKDAAPVGPTSGSSIADALRQF